MFHSCMCVSPYMAMVGLYRGPCIRLRACMENIQSSQVINCIRLPDSTLAESYSSSSWFKYQTIICPFYLGSNGSHTICKCLLFLFIRSQSLHTYIYIDPDSRRLWLIHSHPSRPRVCVLYVYIYIYISQRVPSGHTSPYTSGPWSAKYVMASRTRRMVIHVSSHSTWLNSEFPLR